MIKLCMHLKEAKLTICLVLFCVFLCVWPNLLEKANHNYIWPIFFIFAVIIIMLPVMAIATKIERAVSSIDKIEKLLVIYFETIMAFGCTYFLFGFLGDTNTHFNYSESFDVTKTGFLFLLEQLFNFIYFSTITISTIGYGDIYPVSIYTKILVMLEYFIGMYILLFGIGRLVATWVPNKQINKD